MQCPHCHAENPEKAKFCLECGEKFAARCLQCGAELPSAAKFCNECGAKVAAPAPAHPTPSASDLHLEQLKRLVPKEYAERLLSNRGKAEGERRLVTILFSDVKGSTAMAEHLDPEDVLEIMNGAFDVLIRAVYRYEGTLARLMGDAILAFFGAPLAHEDDPERAVHCALEIMAGIRVYAARLEKERGITGFNVRVGINSGLVVVGEVGSDLRVEYTAMGDAINLAARMEQNAPVGGILISHDTYRLVQGVFDVQALEPVLVKGKSEPVRVYRVEGARPRALRTSRRGLEGIQTRMIGREAELKALQEAFYTAVEDSQCQVVTIVGDAGLGKSRLLSEFNEWAALNPQRCDYFVGRALPETQNTPYALLRDLLFSRCAILDNDPPALVQEKLVRGLANARSQAAQAEMQAHLIGALLGCDFSDSPHLASVKNDPQQLRDRALQYLVEYFKALSLRAPLLIVLEDIHWADDSSLNALNQWALALNRLLIVCAARPSLFERRPHWGEGQSAHLRLDLRPLSRRESRRLVAEVLQKVEVLPETLRERVAGEAEGNPFYIEELIKMLIEDGVIRKGAERWQVNPAHLEHLRIPHTLTEVLQARLDSLPLQERTLLQQASVAGPVFWDSALLQIAQAAENGPALAEVPALLNALYQREMIYQHETSAFAEAREYIFRHTTLRDVTYQSLLKQVRRRYHALLAEWLIARTAVELPGLIADHLEQAGENQRALRYLRQAGLAAQARYANAEAALYLQRALVLTPAEDLLSQWELRLAQENVLDGLGQHQPQLQVIAELENLATRLNDAEKQAEAALRRSQRALNICEYPAAIAAAQDLIRIAHSASLPILEAEGQQLWGSALYFQGDYPAARQHIQQALAHLQTAASTGRARPVEAICLRRLGDLADVLESSAAAIPYYERALPLHQSTGDRRGAGITLDNLGAAYYGTGQIEKSRLCWQQALDLAREIGYSKLESSAQGNLGAIHNDQDQPAEARVCFERARHLAHQAEDRLSEAIWLMALSSVHTAERDFLGARAYLQQALQIHQAIGAQTFEIGARSWLARNSLALGQYPQAIEAYQHLVGHAHQAGSRLEAMALSGLGLSCQLGGDTAAALAHIRAALALAQETASSDEDWVVILYNSGLVYAEQALWPEAHATFQRALAIHTQLPDPSLSADNTRACLLSFLAWISLAQAQPSSSEALAQALAQIETVLAQIRISPNLYTSYNNCQPLRVYWQCYQILRTAHDPRAEPLLKQAHALLQDWAAKILASGNSEAEKYHTSFLTQVAVHRDIMAENAAPRVPGVDRGRIVISPDFDDPLNEFNG